MANSISAYGAMWSINENELVTLTRDDIFDMLEDFEDSFSNAQKNLARIIAKTTDDNAWFKYDRIKNALNTLDTFWESIRNSSVKEFYINSYTKRNIEKNDDIISAFFDLLDNIFYKGTIILRTCDIEFTINGAELKIEERTDNTPYYICFRHTNGANSYTYDTRRNYNEVILEINELNKNARFFKCKECNKLTYVSKSDDEWKTAHGLQPVQRCRNCIQRRKTEKS